VAEVTEVTIISY